MFLQLFLKRNPALLNLKNTVLKRMPHHRHHGRGVRRAANFLVQLMDHRMHVVVILIGSFFLTFMSENYVSGAEVGVIFCKLNVVQINKAESYR
jgi:hypothetical protein